MATPRWRRILITGAAGRLGSLLRSDLRDLAQHVRSSDVRSPPNAVEGEEWVQADLSDMAAVQPLLKDVDAVVHLGAVMPETAWEAVLQANIVGSFNVFEAARRVGVRRIVFASSHHAIGMYDRSQKLDSDSPPRPGNLYGLSKAFGENLARMYHDKHSIEVACLRIGSCFERPSDERMLSTWLSHADMVRLCRRCLIVPELGYSVIYGVSANSRSFWSNEKVAFLGFEPQDSADVHAQASTEARANGTTAAPYVSARAATLQGGRFTDLTP